MNKIDKAFKQIQRIDFVPFTKKDMAYLDSPLLIGYGQTISQPGTVRMMLEWLDVQNGQKVLDIGSGSGWTSALLSSLVGNKGKVFAVEIIPQLLEFGRKNCEKYELKNIEFHLATKNVYGLPELAPFDRILVSAAAKDLPLEIIDQLKIGGKMVIPVKNDILEIIKKSDDNYETVTHPGFIFVPLV